MKKSQAQYAIGRLEDSQCKILMELRESGRTISKFKSQACSDREFAFNEMAADVNELYEAAVRDLRAEFRANEVE